MKKTIKSWGNYPVIQADVIPFKDEKLLETTLVESKKNAALIPYGNGKSYGDSALSDSIIDTKPHHYFLDFDDENGVLALQAGVLLSEIVDIFVPKGWFLKVTPGTKLITVGGAIASDVHGKDHHVAGCFSESILSFRLMLPDGSIRDCSKSENVDLFRSTCGGMGLTGVILDARIALKKIGSQFVNQTTIKTTNLLDTFDAYEKYSDQPYSVAWIDCLAKGEKLGRCLLMAGDFSDDGDFEYQSPNSLSIPFNFPGFALNKLTVKAFNWLYYARIRSKISHQKVSIDTFFYPLDAIRHWNRIYGKNGFTQYQFILPKENSFAGLTEILQAIASAGRGSFLAVLKLYGPANENYLSFPIEGYSLALDFKIDAGLFAFLDHLDQLVVKHKGRVYLAKDVRVSKEAFEKGYPMIHLFRALRKKYKMDQTLNSIQSKRVEI